MTWVFVFFLTGAVGIAGILYRRMGEGGWWLLGMSTFPGSVTSGFIGLDAGAPVFTLGVAAAAAFIWLGEPTWRRRRRKGDGGSRGRHESTSAEPG